MITPITPRLKPTPPQLLGLWDRLSRWKSRLQSGSNSKADSGADERTITAPQERGGVGEAAVIVFLCLRFAGLFTQTYLNQTHEESRYSGGAEHWDPEAYQRGGGGLSQSQPLPAPKTCSISQDDLRALLIDLPSSLKTEFQLKQSVF